MLIIIALWYFDIWKSETSWFFFKILYGEFFLQDRIYNCVTANLHFFKMTLFSSRFSWALGLFGFFFYLYSSAYYMTTLLITKPLGQHWTVWGAKPQVYSPQKQNSVNLRIAYCSSTPMKMEWPYQHSFETRENDISTYIRTWCNIINCLLP